jgi:hypothetical protein
MTATLIHWAVMLVFAAIMLAGLRSIWRDLTRRLDRDHYLKD